MTATGTGAVKVYPATFEQEAMWAADQLSDGLPRYLESWALKLTGPLDLEAARWAFSRLVERHEALRTTLVMEGDQLVQIVVPPQETELARRSCEPSGLDLELRKVVSEPLGPAPVRGSVLCLAPDEFVLVLQVHHTVVDDCALAVIDREFQELYSARVQGRAPRLGAATQLGAYARAQRSTAPDESVVGYWRERLRDAPVRNAPPPDRPRPPAPSWRGGQAEFAISDEAGHMVRQVCRAARTTPFAVFAAALGALVSWYNRTDEVIIGTPVSRRGAAALDGMIGCLTDLLPLRLRIRQDDSFGTLVPAVHETVWEAIAYKDIPYSELLAKAAPRKRLRQLPLCQAVLVVDDVRQAPLQLPGLSAERLYVPSGAAKFDLCMTIVIDHGRYRGFLDYSLDLYSQRSAERVARHFTGLLSGAATASAAPLSALFRTLGDAAGE